jgi:hypothetical protein
MSSPTVLSAVRARGVAQFAIGCRPPFIARPRIWGWPRLVARYSTENRSRPDRDRGCLCIAVCGMPLDRRGRHAATRPSWSRRGACESPACSSLAQADDASVPSGTAKAPRFGARARRRAQNLHDTRFRLYSRLPCAWNNRRQLVEPVV